MATLDEAVKQVRELTDNVGNTSITDAAIRAILNDELAALYAKLIAAFESYSISVAAVSVTSSAARGLPLPADFFKLVRLDRSVSGSATANDWARLERVHIRDESAYSSCQGATRPVGYVLVNDEAWIVPRSAAKGAYQVLYNPPWVPLLGSQPIVIGPTGQRWERYAIYATAVLVCGDQEQDVSVWAAQVARMDELLDTETRNRDAAQAEPPPQTGAPWYDR
jgi:hypothetical protein